MRVFVLAGLALAVPASIEAQSREALPANIIAELKAAPNQGGIYNVNGDKTFSGKILKADTITFNSKSKLRLTGSYPYVAVVARRILVGAPDEQFSIVASPGRAAYVQSPKPPHPGKARSGNSGSPKSNGENGAHGVNGVDGSNGLNGRSAPTLYIIANVIQRQDGTVPPTFADVSLDTQGQNGEAGQDGQDGQHGGNGGSGGPSVSGLFGCEGGAGSGGNGGNGGAGGRGGNGGNGGRGGDIYYGGSDAVMDLFSFASTITFGGKGGAAGSHGMNGDPGIHGPRGPHTGNCGGGADGQDGRRTSKSHSNRAGTDADAGRLYYAPIDATTLFP